MTFTLSGHGIAKSAAVLTRDKSAGVIFSDLSVAEWSAEDPVLYDIYFETSTGCVKEKIGFRTVEIKVDVLYFNGKKIKFKGVNHHDTSPTNGYTMTPDEIERDVKLCKEFNIDTIRTSHYPPDPLLLELADELGVYIVDENDLETHGTFAHQLPPTYNSISHDPRWQKHYLDRITRLYQRDKIHGNTAIFMWSLGNEAGAITTPTPCTTTSRPTPTCLSTMRAPSTASGRHMTWAAKCTPAWRWCITWVRSAGNRNA